MRVYIPQLLVCADIAITKSDYFLMAEQMKKEEIPAEVGEKLDLIKAIVCP